MPFRLYSLYSILNFSASRTTQIQKATAPFSTFTKVMAKEYKIKGLSSLDLQKGEKREVEVDGMEGGKVLLVNHNGKTHAMSSNCTHYGAPLKLGVLNPEGRLTCAWHGGESQFTFHQSSSLKPNSMLQRCDWRRRRRACSRSVSKIRDLGKGRRCIYQGRRRNNQSEPKNAQCQMQGARARESRRGWGVSSRCSVTVMHRPC